ncbi:methyl-accepting chemotaxis protein [Phytobacter diazotrophicus]|nr:methyl-accepting chemotaxis protein [Phytobacter diazotrophicus]
MNITKRLLLTFSLLIISLIITNVISLYSMQKIGKDSEYFQVNILPSLDVMNKESAKIATIRGRLFLHGLTEDQAGMDQIKQEVFKFYDELTAMQQNYIKNLISDQHDLDLSNKTLADLQSFRPLMDKYFKISESNDRQAIIDAMKPGGTVVSHIDVLTSDFNEQIAYNTLLVDNANKSISSLIYRSMMISIGATSLATLILGIFGLMTVLNVKNRLNTMRDGMVTISENLDLNSEIPTGRQDEIGLAVSAFNSLLRRMSEALILVRAASHSVSTAANQISVGNQELSARTEQQSAAVVETAASMEELSSTVKQNAQNALQASQLAISASGNAGRGGDVVGTAIARMKEISESSTKIKDITSVINSIAFQTNILALNAAVEAARAGEQGRGFAVVAGEVRNLAQRSAQAAKEIETLINASVSQIEEGTRQVDLAGETMIGIVNSVTQVKDLMQEIAAASDEQDRGISQIATAMTEMDTTTQQNAALVQESSAAANSLEEQATKLQEMVNVFRLPGIEDRATTPRSNVMQAPRIAVASVGGGGRDADWQSF